jgi:threonine/homoserine/homoserine lactone efflux protein
VLSSLIAIVPTAGVLFLFWIGIRALVQADRRERQAQARIEAAERLAEAARSRESGNAVRPAGPPEPEPGSDL